MELENRQFNRLPKSKQRRPRCGVGCSCLVVGCLAIPLVPTGSVPRFFMDKIQSKDFQVIINSQADKKIIESLNQYWDFHGKHFLKKIGAIGVEIGMEYAELLRIIKKYSTAYIYDNCGECNKELFHSVKSQTKFLEYFNRDNYCPKCQTAKEKIIAKYHKQARKRHIIMRKQILNRAIQVRAWEELSIDENRVLLHIIENPKAKINFGNLQNLTFGKKQELIDKYVSLGLIALPLDYGYYQAELGYSKYLPDRLKYYLEECKNNPFPVIEEDEDAEIPF